MDAGPNNKEERILLADSAQTDLHEAGETLTSFFPTASVAMANSLEQFQDTLGTREFDIVVLDYDLSQQTNIIELMYRLKTEDYEPSIVVLSKNPQAQIVNELYKHGCHRCIVKDDRWLEELGSAVDYLFRWRKAMRENLTLRAKLTEANMLLMEKNQRLDDFSATLAHDIRGPLGGISMKLDFLLDNHNDELQGRVRELMERCLKSTDRLTDMVQSMYEFAKL